MDNHNRREGRLHRFLYGPLTGLGVVLLLAVLAGLGWLATTADFYLQVLGEDHGPWAVRAALLGVACLVLLWALVAHLWPRR